MWDLIAIPLTCWACMLVALPRKPRFGNKVEELVYSRLLGRHQRLLLLAIFVTIAMAFTLLVTLPRHGSPDLQAARAAQRVCTHPVVGFPTCYEQQANRMWAREEMQSDGTWLAVATVAAPEVVAP
jgi:hypothetical protein